MSSETCLQSKYFKETYGEKLCTEMNQAARDEKKKIRLNHLILISSPILNVAHLLGCGILQRSSELIQKVF